MFRRHVYQQAAAEPEGGSGGGGAAGVIQDAGGAGGGGGGGAAEGGDLPTGFGELSPDLAAVVREAKWQDPGQAVKSYNDLLSLKGAPADRLLKLPGSPDSDESKAYLAQHLGVPGEASEYDLSVVTLPEGAVDIRDSITEALHAARVPGDAAAPLVDAIAQAYAAKSLAAEEEADAKFAQAKDQLTGEWGGESQQRWANVSKAYKLLGLDDSQADKIALEGEGGVSEFFKRLELLGSRMGEPTDHGAMPEGGGDGGFLTAKQAEARLDEIEASGADQSDPKVRSEIDRLSRIARPGKVSI
ncbi:MAG: hypothetical protein NXI30_04485 [bacterium]|nr:hypothetical protein [bacterium]